LQNLLLTLPAAVLPLGLLIGMGIGTLVLVQTVRAQQLLLKQAEGEIGV
jgi:hypothetical protein